MLMEIVTKEYFNKMIPTFGVSDFGSFFIFNNVKKAGLKIVLIYT